jgi:copper resistance protein C
VISHPLARRSRALLLALPLAAALLLVAAPASAHDELVSTDPAAGSTVGALPAQLTLTFNEAVSAEQGATEMQVTDAAGTSLVAGPASVADNVVTQPLEGAASGVITVLWKVVSDDGHPVSDQFSFTVTPAATPTPTPSPTATSTPTPTATPEQSATPTPSALPVEAGDSSDALPWIIGGIILAAVLGALVYLLASRSRRERDKAALEAATQSPTESAPPQGR